MRHLWALLALTACFDKDSDTTSDVGAPDPGGHCEYTASDLPLDDAAALGFTLQSVVDAVGGARDTVLKWDATGDTTDLQLELTVADGAGTLHTGEWIAPEGDTGLALGAPESSCDAWADLGASLRFVTADGRLDEQLAVRVVATGEGVGRVDVTVDAADLQGSGPLVDFDPTVWDEVSYAFAANMAADTTGGEIAVSASREVPDTGVGDDDVVIGEGMAGDIARWPWPQGE